MKISRKQIVTAAGFAGAMLACLPCCIPLIAPVLAWFGISALGVVATGWYAGMAGVFVLGMAAILLIRHRVAARRCASSRCDCQDSCQVDFPSTRSGEQA